MQIHNVQQRTDEWHALRNAHGTASQAACIMGCSPWMPRTWRELVEVKTGVREIPVLPHMRAGSEDEPIIQNHYELETDQLGNDLVVSDGVMLASLDWTPILNDPFDPITKIAEFKRPFKGTESDLWKMAQKGGCPDHYYAQIQHQLAVTGALSCDLVVYAHDIDFIHIVEIPPDYDYQEELRSKWAEFWRYYGTGKMPPAQDRDIIDVDDIDLIDFTTEWKEVSDKLDVLKNREKELRGWITGFADEGSIQCNGVVVERIVRSGTIDWKELVDDQQLDDSLVERFRKKPTVYHRLRAA